MVEFDQNQLLIDFFDLLIDFFDLLIDLIDLFNDILIEIDQIQIKIEIVDSDSLLDFDSDGNRQSKSTGLKSKLSTIQFVSPNRISLVSSGHFTSINHSLEC